MAADDERMNAVVKIQCIYRAGLNRAALAEKLDKKMGGTWEAFADDETGETYYYNHITGESVWEEPEGFDAEKSKAAKKAVEENGCDGLPKKNKLRMFKSFAKGFKAPAPKKKYQTLEDRLKAKEEALDRKVKEAEAKEKARWKAELAFEKKSREEMLEEDIFSQQMRVYEAEMAEQRRIEAEAERKRLEDERIERERIEAERLAEEERVRLELLRQEGILRANRDGLAREEKEQRSAPVGWDPSVHDTFWGLDWEADVERQANYDMIEQDEESRDFKNDYWLYEQRRQWRVKFMSDKEALEKKTKEDAETSTKDYMVCPRRVMVVLLLFVVTD
jgi:hypothetical protein